MEMLAERNKERIKEFFELSETDFNLRKFHKPVLVYAIDGDKVRFSLWEEEMLEKFGLENVDGWDRTEELIFCPDWMQGNEDDEDLEDIKLEDDDF